MNENEKTLLLFDDLLKKIGLDYMIFASSLLHIIREGYLVPEDVEVDIAVHGNDLTDNVMSKIDASGYKGVAYDCCERYGEFYLWRTPGRPPSTPHVAVNPIWKKKGIVYQNVSSDACLVWDSKYYDKSTWLTLKYLGRKFKVPSDPEEWLEKWYGSDWKTPKASHWTGNKNLKKYNELWPKEAIKC